MKPEWQKHLMREASSHHMCEENRSLLAKVETKSDAIALYKKTIDWALEQQYPSWPVLRRFFSDSEADGIFIGKEFHGEVLDFHQVYVFHNCRGTIYTGLNEKRAIIPMLYFANNCDMTVKYRGPEGLAVRVPFYIFGDNTVLGENSENMVSQIYKFDVR